MKRKLSKLVNEFMWLCDPCVHNHDLSILGVENAYDKHLKDASVGEKQVLGDLDVHFDWYRSYVAQMQTQAWFDEVRGTHTMKFTKDTDRVIVLSKEIIELMDDYERGFRYEQRLVPA